MNIEALAREAGFVSAEFWPDDFKGLHATVTRFAALLREAVVRELVGSGVEPVAYMYPDDHERMTTTETFCTVYSVRVGSPTQGLSTVALYTHPAPSVNAQQRIAELEAALDVALEALESEDNINVLMQDAIAKIKEVRGE